MALSSSIDGGHRNDMPRLNRFLVLVLLLGALLVSGSVWPVSAQEEGAAAPTAYVPLEPGPVIVMLKTGEQMRGTLIEDRPSGVKLMVAEIEVRVPRDRIEAVYPENDIMERYRLLRESIPPGDVEQILFLAEWLRRNDMLDEALAETESALKADPSDSDAIRMRRLVEQQIKMRDRAKERRERAAEGGAGEDRRTGAALRQRRGEFPLITEKDANLIKVFEVNLAAPPKMVIEKETIDALLDGYGGRLGVPSSNEGRATFYSKPPAEILGIMYRLRARDLYADVRVLDVPQSLKTFRDSVNSTWLVNSCATSRCHGGMEAGALRLANRKPSAERSFLTNFLILERHTLADGTPMINYESPASSPLLQMTLPRHESLFPHPKVKRWRPVFSNTNARRYQQAVDWIEGMYKPRPTYPIEYEAPTGRAPGAGDDSGGESTDSPEPGEAPIER